MGNKAAASKAIALSLGQLLDDWEPGLLAEASGMAENDERDPQASITRRALCRCPVSRSPRCVRSQRRMHLPLRARML